MPSLARAGQGKARIVVTQLVGPSLFLSVSHFFFFFSFLFFTFFLNLRVSKAVGPGAGLSKGSFGRDLGCREDCRGKVGRRQKETGI